jgi:hypothetical protein
MTNVNYFISKKFYNLGSTDILASIFFLLSILFFKSHSKIRDKKSFVPVKVEERRVRQQQQQQQQQHHHHHHQQQQQQQRFDNNGNLVCNKKHQVTVL